MSLSVGRRVDRTTSLVRAIVEEFRENHVSFMAGSIAYSAFVSLFPALLLALLVATTVGGEAFANRVLRMTGQYLTPSGQSLISDALTRASGRTGVSILGVAVLLWSGLKVFRGLDVAFSELYHSPDENGFFDQIRDGVVVFGGIGLAVLAMVGASLFVAFLPEFPYVNAVSFLVLTAALILAFFPIYYVFPDVDVSVHDVLPGTVVAAVGWALLQGLFQVYTQYSSTGELYGVIGGVILLITWLYFGSLVLLIGVVVNVVLSGRSDAGTPPPNPEGRRAPE